MEKSKIRDLSRKRAIFAYEKVENFIKEKGNNTKEANEYKSYVKKIPTMIQTNGLSATLAFMYSKGKTYKIIYNQIEEWLKKREFNIVDESNKKIELVKWVINLDSSEYKYITNEVMALFLWLRRFAEGMIEKEEGNKNGEKEEKE